MFYTYAIYSPNYQKIYIGYTGNLEERLHDHNVRSKKGWTLPFRPWTLVYYEIYETQNAAMKREKQLKSSRGRQFIWDIIKNEKVRWPLCGT